VAPTVPRFPVGQVNPTLSQAQQYVTLVMPSTATTGMTDAAPNVVVTPTISQQTTNTATLVTNVIAVENVNEEDNQAPVINPYQTPSATTLTRIVEGSQSENSSAQEIPMATLNPETETTPTTDPTTAAAADGGEEGGNGNEDEILGF